MGWTAGSQRSNGVSEGGKDGGVATGLYHRCTCTAGMFRNGLTWGRHVRLLPPPSPGRLSAAGAPQLVEVYGYTQEKLKTGNAFTLLLFLNYNVNANLLIIINIISPH